MSIFVRTWSLTYFIFAKFIEKLMVA